MKKEKNKREEQAELTTTYELQAAGHISLEDIKQLMMTGV